MSLENTIIHAIDTSPLNRGLSGAAWIAHAGNVPVVMGEDIALFDDEGDCTYQVHFLFASRGKAAVASAKEAFRQMFEQHGADLIFGMTPVDLPQAKVLAKLAGGKLVGQRETEHGPCDLFVLSKEMWSEK